MIKKYEDADNRIKKWLEEIVAETLYDHILHSTGDEKTLSEIFAVPVGLIRAIKELI